jgi:hypothetical protein
VDDSVVGYIYSQARVLKRWRAVWRVIGALPALAIGGYAVKLAVDWSKDPTSHNLWPVEILILCLGGLAFLGACAVVRVWSRE